MAELRYDEILDKFVIIPDNHKVSNTNGKCSYCLGNESLTEPAVLTIIQQDGMLKRIYDDNADGWCIRMFPSDEPIVNNSLNTDYTDRPFMKEPAYGYHYKYVITPDHTNPCKLSKDLWVNILVGLQDRIKWLYSKKGVAYVSVSMSYSKAIHPHMDIITFSFIPPMIEKESNAIKRYIDENGGCPLCNLAKVEFNNDREILHMNNFIAICPWVSSYTYEFNIIPRKHTVSFTKVSQKDINDLALIIRSTLGGLYNVIGDTGFNMVFRLPSEKKQSKTFHWYIKVYPNKYEYGILEKEFGIYINSIKPEHAADMLGKESRKEFARLMEV